jgi:hypothetical protein
MGAAAFAVSLATPALAHADPIRILLAVSHSRGAPGELPLLHAAADVEHVQRVLTELGDFPSADVITLVDPTLASLDGALASARALAAAHTPDEVTFVFYFSGHGDRDQIHLGPESLTAADLSARVRAVPAALRLVVTDACRNYPTRAKGIATEPGFAIQNPAAPPGEGVVWLYSSREGESSLESDELAGALFTHYWVSALRGAGDANGDGRVTLGESYDFAYSQTLLRSSRSSGVLQHPSAVFDLREVAPIVLTKTSSAGAIVRFPRAADAHFLVYAIGSRAIVGELWGSAERDVAFALPSGRYLVQRTTGAGSAATEFSLAPGEAHSLRADEFHAAPEEQLATKGGNALLRPNELGVELSAEASRLATLAGSAGLRYAHQWDEWALSLGVAGGRGTQNTGAENVTLESIETELTAERRWALGPVTFGAGLGGEADVMWQTLERTDAVRVAAAGYATTQRNVGLAPGPIAVVRLRVDLGFRTWIEAAARGGVLFPELSDGATGMWIVRAGVGAGVKF